MKKSILCLAGFTMLTLAFTSCKQEAKNENATEQTEMNAENAVYSCPMHPDVKSDQPGSCPQCGMDLEKVEHSSEHMDNNMHE